MGEDGSCWRCGVAYPWPAWVGCRRLRRAPSDQPVSDTMRWLMREGETRAALGSTPLTRDEAIQAVLRRPPAANPERDGVGVETGG